MTCRLAQTPLFHFVAELAPIRTNATCPTGLGASITAPGIRAPVHGLHIRAPGLVLLLTLHFCQHCYIRLAVFDAVRALAAACLLTVGPDQCAVAWLSCL